MGRGSASASQSNKMDLDNEMTDTMVMECESEDLSDAQLSRIQSLKDEVVRLSNLLQLTGKQNTSEVAPVPALLNGTALPSPATTPLTNGPGTLPVGLQVPQFLILQNGQMIATNPTIPPASIAGTNQASTFPINTAPGTISSNLNFKPTNSRIQSTPVAPPLTRPQIRVVTLDSVSNGKNTSASPAVVPTVTAPPLIAPVPPTISIANNSDDIQVLSELPAQVKPSSSATPSSSAGTLRDVRLSLMSKNTSSTNGTKNTSKSASASASSAAAVRNNIDDDVVPLTNSNTSVRNTVTTASPATASASASQATGALKYPLLSIVARPRNTLPPSISLAQRKELDTQVKLILVKSPHEFVEWLLSKGMIRTSQKCTVHMDPQTNRPSKLKLGMFSDPKALATSGGYVWISECCWKKYVSVYSGSIFGSTPIDKVPPASVMKLVYHWACQTSISNVENWVKVDKAFINKIYQYLRCVCAVMLHDKVHDFGSSTVELGIVSLGTSTADGAKKSVKVEILGLFDRKTKSYRLFASEPEPGTSSKQRFVRILKPLENVVRSDAIILCDQSVDRNHLYSMHYDKVVVCESSDSEDDPSHNGRIMAYLRKHVPKMFQSTLSQLNLAQVQLVLDELCWRERFGHCAAYAYSNMVEHITYITTREAQNPGVLHLLDYVAQSPHYNWRYKNELIQNTSTSLQPSIIMSPGVFTTSPTSLPIESQHVLKLPIEQNNHAPILKATPVSRTSIVPPTTTTTTTVKVSDKSPKTELEPFFYGQIQGDATLGHESNSAPFVCHLCNEESDSNVGFYMHLKLHLHHGPQSIEKKLCCDYCVETFPNQEKRIFHQRVKHMHMDTRFLWCRICSEAFPSEHSLVTHMTKKHYESECPYRCEVCSFVTSIFYSLIDHFNTEHKNTSYIQCHYCLHVFFITPANASGFSAKVYHHMQKHLHQQSRCKSCQLVFHSKTIVDEHKRKDHIRRSNFPGLQRFKISAGQKYRIMFKPGKRPPPPPPPPAGSYQSVALSSTLEWLDFKMNIPEPDDYHCVECNRKFSYVEHFKSYLKCTRCKYSTCCRNMIVKHVEAFHPSQHGKKFNMGAPIVLPKPLFCICGFSSVSGNHLARHLISCEGGRKSAYPSMSSAMVYQGDVTGSMLSLASIGFNNFGTLSSLIPDVAVTDSDVTEVPMSGSLDMTHFMSVSMEVDES